MVRLADMTKRSQFLQIKMQHVYHYSKWDAVHEPYNLVENVLRDDDKEYKAMNPSIDLTVNDGKPCFISNVLVHPGDTGP
jgi:transcription elongation factor GreA-like protein